MSSGLRALVSGCIAFIVATTTILLFNRNHIDAMTIGGLTGGAVALSVWITVWRDDAESDTTTT